MKTPRVSKRKEIIKIWAEVNEKETIETTAKINKTKRWFFEEINNVDKALAIPIQKEIASLKRSITGKKIETVIKIFQQTKAHDQMASQVNSTKNLEV